jgi:glutamate-ammonia-ligase adenylyltransferase
LFDLKHDEGGMIDIEFIVQFLVLLYASHHPQLTGDIGNIALLKLCGQLGLIDGELSVQVADAYRVFRKLQHQLRLQGEEKARVDSQSVSTEVEAVTALYQEVFG